MSKCAHLSRRVISSRPISFGVRVLPIGAPPRRCFRSNSPSAPTAAPRPTDTGRRAEPARGPATAATADAAERSFEPNRIRVAQGSDDSRKSGARRALGIVVLLALLGGGGWYAWQSGAIASLTDSFSAPPRRASRCRPSRRPTAPPATVAAAETPSATGRPPLPRSTPAPRSSIRNSRRCRRGASSSASSPTGTASNCARRRNFPPRSSPSRWSTSSSPRRWSPCAASTPTTRCPPAPSG